MNRLIMLGTPVINKPMNWNNLGLVLKDGTINFASRDAVLEYAKNQVKKGLHAKEPYEVYVAWKDNRVLGVTKGTRRSVNKPKNLPEGCSGMHGHVRELPISEQDYLMMMLDNAYEEIALCPSGRYSRIVKLDGEDINLETTQRKVLKTYKSLKRAAQISKFIHTCQLKPFLVKLYCTKLIGSKINNKDYNRYCNKLIEYCNKLIEFDKKVTADSSKLVKNIFEKLGPESGVQYESNLICE